MKIKLTFILMLLCTAITINKTSAFTLNSFYVESPYVSSGNVLLNSNPTNFVFNFEVSRSMNYYNSNYAIIDLYVTLVFRDSGGTETALSTPVNVTTAHFGDATYPIYRQRVNASIPSSYTGGTILLHITGQEWRDYYHDYLPINTYSSVTYGQTSGGTPISPPVLYPTLDAFPYAYTGQTFNMIFTDPQTLVSATRIYPSDSTPILTTGTSITSPNGTFRFTLQTDGNLVLYRKNPNLTETPIWASYTQGSGGTSVYYQTDGHMVIYNSSHVGLWASTIYNNAGLGTVSNAFYALQDDGNLVFYWPMYYHAWGREPGWIVAGASDTAGGGTSSSHWIYLNHTLDPYPAFQGTGSQFYNTR